MENEEEKFLMINAASKALDYRKKHPEADSEEIIKKIMHAIEASEKLKLMGIASADDVLKLRSKQPRATDKEIMNEFMSRINIILERFEEE